MPKDAGKFERMEKLAQDCPGLRKKLVPLLKKRAGWKTMTINPGKKVTDRMIEEFVRKSEYPNAVKGSVEWKDHMEFGKLDWSVRWYWSMKEIDPETQEEHAIGGEFVVRMSPDRSYEAWLGVHT